MIYFLLITIGDGMAESIVLSPFFGMWGPNIILSPIADLLMMSDANDRSVVTLPKIFKKKKKNAYSFSFFEQTSFCITTWRMHCNFVRIEIFIVVVRTGGFSFHIIHL